MMPLEELKMQEQTKSKISRRNNKDHNRNKIQAKKITKDQQNEELIPQKYKGS
jgi:hypothetical protein